MDLGGYKMHKQDVINIVTRESKKLPYVKLFGVVVDESWPVEALVGAMIFMSIRSLKKELKHDGARSQGSRCLTCLACGFVGEVISEWNEVYSNRHKCFINFCCPKCKVVGNTRFVLSMYNEPTSQRNLAGVVVLGHQQ